MAPSHTAVTERTTGTAQALETVDGELARVDSSELDSTLRAKANAPGTIQVTVLDQKGTVTGAKVTATCPGKATVAAKFTPPGTYAITGLPKGVCTVKVTHAPKHVEQSKEVTVQSSKIVFWKVKLLFKVTVPPAKCDRWTDSRKAIAACIAAYPGNTTDELIRYNNCWNRAVKWYDDKCVGPFNP